MIIQYILASGQNVVPMLLALILLIIMGVCFLFSGYKLQFKADRSKSDMIVGLVLVNLGAIALGIALLGILPASCSGE